MRVITFEPRRGNRYCVLIDGEAGRKPLIIKGGQLRSTRRRLENEGRKPLPRLPAPPPLIQKVLPVEWLFTFEDYYYCRACGRDTEIGVMKKGPFTCRCGSEVEIRRN